MRFRHGCATVNERWEIRRSQVRKPARVEVLCFCAKQNGPLALSANPITKNPLAEVEPGGFLISQI